MLEALGFGGLNSSWFRGFKVWGFRLLWCVLGRQLYGCRVSRALEGANIRSGCGRERLVILVFFKQ